MLYKRFLFGAFLGSLALISFTISHSFFSDQAVSSSNTFTSAAVFPTTTPTPTLTVMLNEFVYNPGELFNSEWIELYNAGPSSVDLTGWEIEDLVGNDRDISSLGTINSIEIKSFDLPGPEFLNNSSSETVLLKDNLGNVIDSHDYTDTDTDDESIGRETDGGSTWKTCTIPSKGTSNNGSC